MKILIACESSGTVRDSFIRKGHQAVSCDLLPTEFPGPHYHGSVLDILDESWDMMIAHPPCTYLTTSAEWCYTEDTGKRQMPGVLYGEKRIQARFEAIAFFRVLHDCKIPKIVIENPVGIISTVIRKPDQIIQPYEFGDDASKKTALWLKGVPLLTPTHRFQGRMVFHNGKFVERWTNQTDSGQNRLGPSEDRWKIRSKTYQGIADAMAEQWG